MQSNSSWEGVEEWYGDLVGKEGHFFHKEVIFPRLLPLLNFSAFHSPSLLDLACGQGVLSNLIPKEIPYQGVDLSPSLIRQAKQGQGKYQVADICAPLSLGTFTHVTCILALQNVARADLAIQNAHKHLETNGIFVFVLNHPCFRIPRQTHWEVDEAQKLQYRRVNRYLSPLKIPIQANPVKGSKSQTTWSFHHPLSDYTKWLYQAGFMIQIIEEWVSPKQSTGKAAKMENRARSEFPLFLTIKAIKHNYN
ncbi:MAG: class I SAM-dependent methyltransferase [Chlamydiales bacterium]